jgi:hypothetical protein
MRISPQTVRVGIDLLLIVILHAASTQTAGPIRAIEQLRSSSATHLILLDRQVSEIARGRTKVARLMAATIAQCSL